MQNFNIAFLFITTGRKNTGVDYLTIIHHKRALDMRSQIAKEVRSAELAIITSYPTSVSGIIVLLKTTKKYC